MNHFTISKIYGNMGYIPVFSVGRIRIKDQVSRLQFTIADSHSFVYQAFCFACCIHSIQISNTSCSITPVNQGRTIIPSRIISSALGITTSYSIQSCLHGSISVLSGTYAFFPGPVNPTGTILGWCINVKRPIKLRQAIRFLIAPPGYVRSAGDHGIICPFNNFPVR